MTAPGGVGLLLLLAALHAAPASAQESTSFKGRPLTDVLQELQAQGLRIIFSSAIVRPELRVNTDQRAATPRKQLDEVLAPHGLAVREGPGQTLQVVRAAKQKPERHETRSSLKGPVEHTHTAVPPGGVRVREYISVVDSIPARTDRGVASESSLGRDDLARLAGSLADDPFRAAEAFAGVTAVDDFRGDIAVRGSPFRQVGLVVDGVPAQWLRHISVGSDAAGSLAMLSGFVVERATLRSGAYPRRHNDRLGAELDLTLREGSRRELAFKGALGGGHAVLVAEGPLGGKTGESGLARGSWLVSGRQSYLEWPSQRSTSSRTPFGFSDALAKIVFDVRPTERIAVTVLRGISSTDEDEDSIVPAEFGDGINAASAVSLSWQSTIRPAFVLRQRIVWTAQRSSGYRTLARAYENEAFAYRADVSRPVARGMLEAGGLVERTRWKSDATSADTSSWVRSGFAHLSWPVTSALTLSPGVRVTWSTLTSTPAVSRWLLGEWTFRRGWSLIGSAGASRQLPELRYYTSDTHALAPEQASHVEAGVEQRMTSGVRWQATIFSRREADVIRFPRLHPRLIGGDLIFPAPDEGYANALGGTSRGVELLISRSSARGLTGWASYSYGRTRQRDIATAETFWADFDQRHAFKVFARYRRSPSTSVGMTFRAGSNFPIPGYFRQRDGALVVGSVRNDVRLRPYARLDLRADRQFRYRGRSFTLFVEGLNALNRANVGLADGSIDTETLAAVGFTDTLLRRRASAGVVFEF